MSALIANPFLVMQANRSGADEEMARESAADGLTGKQRMALMLAKAGYSHATIASKLGLKHRETATRLIARARRQEASFLKAVAHFLKT